MPVDLQRQFPGLGSGPFGEVWFGEVAFGDRGLWFRYTIGQGAHDDVSLWAIYFDRDRIVAHKTDHALTELAGNVVSVQGTDNTLTATRASGHAGEVSWDLQLTDAGRTHRMVPRTFRALGIGRTYVPAILDLRAKGTIRVGNEVIEVDDARGVLGHIWGKSNKTQSWAWAHCSDFAERDDAIFEALGARIGLGSYTTPVLSALCVHLGDQRYMFSGTRDLFRNQTWFGPGRMSFAAKRGPVSIAGEVHLPESRTAVVRYVTQDGREMFCSNSRFATLKLLVVDRAQGIEQELTSEVAAFETGDAERPETLHIE